MAEDAMGTPKNKGIYSGVRSLLGAKVIKGIQESCDFKDFWILASIIIQKK